MLKKHWHDASVVQYCLSLTEEPDVALDRLVQILEVDEGFWVAAYKCGRIYALAKNWEAACIYFRKTLQSSVVRQVPKIHVLLGLCLTDSKDFAAAEQVFATALALDPDYPGIQNCWGWALYRQGKYEAALAVFEESIRRGNDGTYPVRNRIRTLKRLGRFKDALDMLEAIQEEGKPAKWVEREVAVLHRQMEKTGREQEEGWDAEIEEEETSLEASPIEETVGSQAENLTAPTGNERILEDLIEARIKKGGVIFDRRLRMYKTADHYGRQLVLPGVGRIDLLVEDLDANELVVIELKRGKGDEEVVDQITRYMDWIRETIADPRPVKGIVCVHNVSERLRRSAKTIPDLELYAFDLSFEKQ